MHATFIHWRSYELVSGAYSSHPNFRKIDEHNQTNLLQKHMINLGRWPVNNRALSGITKWLCLSPR